MEAKWIARRISMQKTIYDEVSQLHKTFCNQYWQTEKDLIRRDSQRVQVIEGTVLYKVTLHTYNGMSNVKSSSVLKINILYCENC